MATTKVTIQAKDFAKALETAAQLINSKNALPILGDVLLRYRRGTGWTMTSSNSEAWLTFPLPQMTLIENKVDGRNVHPDEALFCIPAAARQIFSQLPETMLQMWFDSDRLLLSVEFPTSDSTSGRFSLPYDAADDYPMGVPMAQAECCIKVPAKQLLPMVKSARVAVAQDELRPQMQGVCIDITQEGYSVVASDGHALVSNGEHVGLGSGFLTGQPRQVLVHSSLINTLLSAFQRSETITVEATATLVVISADGTEQRYRPAEGKYPNWQSVIPRDQPYHVTLNRADLTAVLKRVALFASDSSQLIRLCFEDGMLTVNAEDIDQSRSAVEHVILQDSNVPDRFSIGVKSTTLAAVLGTPKTENIHLYLTEAKQPIVVREEDVKSLYCGLLMPMLLSDAPAAQ